MDFIFSIFHRPPSSHLLSSLCSEFSSLHENPKEIITWVERNFSLRDLVRIVSHDLNEYKLLGKYAVTKNFKATFTFCYFIPSFDDVCFRKILVDPLKNPLAVTKDNGDESIPFNPFDPENRWSYRVSYE